MKIRLVTTNDEARVCSVRHVVAQNYGKIQLAHEKPFPRRLTRLIDSFIQQILVGGKTPTVVHDRV